MNTSINKQTLVFYLRTTNYVKKCITSKLNNIYIKFNTLINTNSVLYIFVFVIEYDGK